MAYPTSWPTWRYWADGRTALVATPQAFAALPPGHAASPAGPFPAPAAPDASPDRATTPQRVRALREAGQSQRAIAQARGVDRRTGQRAREDTDDDHRPRPD